MLAIYCFDNDPTKLPKKNNLYHEFKNSALPPAYFARAQHVFQIYPCVS